MTLFLQASLIIFVCVTLLWIWSVNISNASIADIFWGMGFVIVNAFYTFMSGELNVRKLLVICLVTLWGMRLTLYLAWRNIGKGEDFRYQEFRKKFGQHNYWWISYFQTFLLQGILLMIISLPLLGVSTGNHSNELSFLDYTGIFLWIIGFAFEGGGDYQLARFKNNPANKGKVLNTGFWRYTRHPNYYGDAVVWWSYGLFSLAAHSYWHIIGSLLMTVLLIKISGVALLEKTLTITKPHYQDYIRKTNSFFPWLPKK